MIVDGLLAGGRDGADAAKLRLQRLDIADVEGLGLGAGAAGSELARPDREQIAAELGQIRGHLGRRAVADRHHGDDRADADDDAEHGQKRAQRIAQDRLQSQLDRLIDHHAASLLSTSESMRPSTKRMTRWA